MLTPEHVCSYDNLVAFEKSGNLAGNKRINSISAKNRYSALNWSLEWRNIRKLKWDTWFHTVTLFDRCLEVIDFSKDKIQSYLIACMFISAKKYEICFPFDVADYVFICDDQVSTEEIINLEKQIVSAVHYNLEFPNLMEYIRYISSVSKVFSEVHELTKMLCVHYVVFNTNILPTVLVTATHNIACRIVGNCNGKNPFSIDQLVINNVCTQIQRRILINNKDRRYNITDIILRHLENKAPSFNWVNFTDRVQLLTFTPNSDIDIHIDNNNMNNRKIDDNLNKLIPNDLTPDYYVNNRRYIMFRIKKDDIHEIKSLGTGGFGEIYKVQIDGEFYAVKKIMNECSESGFSCSFIREVSILQTLSHKNIVTVYNIIDNSESFILDCMDTDLYKYIRDASTQVIRKNQQFQTFCINELLSGLVYMHSCGVIHRDIKSGNILIKGSWPNLEIKYCDFGSARGKCIVLPNAIYTNLICTLNYRSPELLLGCNNYGPCLDVWSLMCTFCEIITGNIFFQGSCEMGQLYSIFKIMGTPTDDDWPNVSSLPEYSRLFPKWTKQNLGYFIPNNTHIGIIISKGLIMDPSKRPSAKTLLEDFNTIRMNDSKI